MTVPFPTPEDLGMLSPEEFDALLVAAQPRLRGYVASILGGWADVDDLVQETNLVLIQKRSVFEMGTSFIAWAFRVAYFKSTTWRRDRMREGRIFFSETTFQEMAGYAAERFERRSPIADTLADCLKRLPKRERGLVEAKYVERLSLVDHAKSLGCSADSLHKRISRIRLTLRDCIRRHHSSDIS